MSKGYALFKYQLLRCVIAILLIVGVSLSGSAGPQLSCAGIWSTTSNSLEKDRLNLEGHINRILAQKLSAIEAQSELAKTIEYQRLENQLTLFLGKSGLQFQVHQGIYTILPGQATKLNRAVLDLQNIMPLTVQHNLAKSLLKRSRGSFNYDKKVLNISFGALIEATPDITFAHEKLHAFLKTSEAYDQHFPFLFRLHKMGPKDPFARDYENLLSFEEILTFGQDMGFLARKLELAANGEAKQKIREEIRIRKILKLRAILSRRLSTEKLLADLVETANSGKIEGIGESSASGKQGFIVRYDGNKKIQVTVDSVDPVGLADSTFVGGQFVEIGLQNSERKLEHVLRITPERQRHFKILSELAEASDPELKKIREFLLPSLLQVQNDFLLLIEKSEPLVEKIERLERYFQAGDWRNFDREIAQFKELIVLE